MCEVLWHAQARNDNENEISNDSLQSSSSSSGKRGCCKVGRSHFLLVFLAYVSYRRRGYLCRQNEWVSDGYNRIPILIQFLLDVNWATHSLFWSIKEDEKHLTIISRWRVKIPKFFLYHIRWSAQHENIQENFFFKRGVSYRLNQRIMPSRSEYTFFSVLAVTLQKMINTSK